MPDPVLFLAPGHGRRPDGTFDPGSIGADGRREHDEAHEVVAFATSAARRCGIPAIVEGHGTNAEEDPNYRGSIRTVNARPSLRLALEVHYDYRLAPDAGFSLHHRTSSSAKRAAEQVAAGFRAEGLPVKGDGVYTPQDIGRSDLSFLAETRPPALIVECARVYDHPASRNRAQAEAIIRGACAFLGYAYVAPGRTPAPPSPEPPKPAPEPAPAPHEGRFTDVPPSSPYFDAVEELAELGIITGYGDGTFRPGETPTRAQLALVVHRLLARIDGR